MNPDFLPDRVRLYQQFIESESLDLRPEFVAAIGDRETLWGTAKDLDLQGPAGTGDFGKRDPSRWGSTLPPDGRGWGRGLMQIDYGSHKQWCLQQTPDGRYLWEVPAQNIRQGCLILHAAATSLMNIAGPHLEAAIACAYNAGPGRAFRALGTLAGKNPSAFEVLSALDAMTTGGDYCTWVLDRRDVFAGESLPR